MDTPHRREDSEPIDEPREPDSTPAADDVDGEERATASELSPSAPENQPIPGENPEDDVLPVSRGRRRLGMYIAMLLILIIVGFLIWFVATHTEQSENGSMFGEIGPHPLGAVA